MHVINPLREFYKLNSDKTTTKIKPETQSNTKMLLISLILFCKLNILVNLHSLRMELYADPSTVAFVFFLGIDVS